MRVNYLFISVKAVRCVVVVLAIAISLLYSIPAPGSGQFNCWLLSCLAITAQVPYPLPLPLHPGAMNLKSSVKSHQAQWTYPGHSLLISPAIHRQSLSIFASLSPFLFLTLLLSVYSLYLCCFIFLFFSASG